MIVFRTVQKYLAIKLVLLHNHNKICNKIQCVIMSMCVYSKSCYANINCFFFGQQELILIKNPICNWKYLRKCVVKSTQRIYCDHVLYGLFISESDINPSE